MSEFLIGCGDSPKGSTLGVYEVVLLGASHWPESPGRKPNRWLPKIPSEFHPLFDSYRTHETKKEPHKETFFFFIFFGCGGAHLFPQCRTIFQMDARFGKRLGTESPIQGTFSRTRFFKARPCACGFDSHSSSNKEIKIPPVFTRGILNFLWLRIGELVRTMFQENPEAFEINEEFYRLNPKIHKDEFEEFLWERYINGDNKALKKHCF